jgi:hypothetical protein
MKDFEYCPHCSKKMRLSEDIGFTVRVNHNSHEFLCELSLIVPEASPKTILLHIWLYRLSWKEKMFEAEIQGRKDDAEEEAFFEEVKRLHKGDEWRRASTER